MSVVSFLRTLDKIVILIPLILADFYQTERQAFQYLLSLFFLSHLLSFSTPSSAEISPPLFGV